MRSSIRRWIQLLHLKKQEVRWSTCFQKGPLGWWLWVRPSLAWLLRWALSSYSFVQSEVRLYRFLRMNHISIQIDLVFAKLVIRWVLHSVHTNCYSFHWNKFLFLSNVCNHKDWPWHLAFMFLHKSLGIGRRSCYGGFILGFKHATAHGTCYQTANTDYKF